LQLTGVGGHRRVIAVHLPLREAVDDRKVRPDRGPDRGHHLGRESGARLQRTAVAVGAVIGLGPEELVEQVAVGAVDLDGVEPASRALTAPRA
jgi:hypothetical protein